MEMSSIGGMNREVFLKMLAEAGPGGQADETANVSWVALKEGLRTRKEPFTVRSIFQELIKAGYETRKNYVYSHLSEWQQTGVLVSLKFGNANAYLHKDQIPEDVQQAIEEASDEE